MNCEVIYFGMIAEKIGLDSEEIPLTSLNFPGGIREFFTNRYPVLAQMTFQVAVDGVIVNQLPENSVKTIALLPPFAGG